MGNATPAIKLEGDLHTARLKIQKPFCTSFLCGQIICLNAEYIQGALIWVVECIFWIRCGSICIQLGCSPNSRPILTIVLQHDACQAPAASTTCRVDGVKTNGILTTLQAVTLSSSLLGQLFAHLQSEPNVNTVRVERTKYQHRQSRCMGFRTGLAIQAMSQSKQEAFRALPAMASQPGVCVCANQYLGDFTA